MPDPIMKPPEPFEGAKPIKLSKFDSQGVGPPYKRTPSLPACGSLLLQAETLKHQPRLGVSDGSTGSIICLLGRAPDAAAAAGGGWRRSIMMMMIMAVSTSLPHC